MKNNFFLCFVLLLTVREAYAQDPRVCEEQADRVYHSCMSGRSDPVDCEFRTICDDVCSPGGEKTCRVFDCRGVLFSSYKMTCVPPRPQHACVRCYQESKVWDNYYQAYKYRHCYKVYDTRDGARTVIDMPCSDFSYDNAFAKERCDVEYGADLRCLANSVW